MFSLSSCLGLRLGKEDMKTKSITEELGEIASRKQSFLDREIGCL